MKNKINKKFFVGALLLVMVAMYGFVPMPSKVKAVDAISDAKDTISESNINDTATHVFTFTTGSTTPDTGYIDIDFPADFGNVTAGGNIVCSSGTASAPDTETARCTAGVGGIAAGALTVTVSNVTNPSSEGVQYIEITNYGAGGTPILERVTVAVYIVRNVWMTARVDSTLNFVVSGLDGGSDTVNGLTCTATSTATSTPFGTLPVGTPVNVCQQLNVTTNADDGFVVTVEEDQELTSDSGSNINSFNNSPNGTGSTTAQAWTSPDNDLDMYHTYGHMGLTSDDADLNSLGGFNSFASGDTDGALQFAGLNSTDPMEVMQHDGPSDGTTQNVGTARVLYRAEIASLQEAGDYENTLTYIVTPQY